MTKIFTILFLLITLNLVSACQNPRLNTLGMPKAPTTGPQEYLTGWNEGCQTGMTTYSNSYLRTRYQTSVNGEMMQHPHYQKGWEVGQSYCSYYISTYLNNKEFFNNDLRSKNQWATLKSDGFFNYSGITKFDGLFQETGEDIPLFSGEHKSLFSADFTFFN